MGNRSGILKVLPIGACALALAACSKTQSQDAYVIPEDGPKVDLKHFDAKTTSLKLADAAYARREYDVAAQLYFRASELQPKNVNVIVKLGFALFKSGSAADAEKIFRVALGKDHDNGDALRGLGHSLVRQGRAAEAIPIYRHALAGPDKGDVRVYAGLGAALDMVGKHGDARAAYQAGLAIAPKDFGLRNNLALSYAMTGDAAKAKAVLGDLSKDPATAPRAERSLSMVRSVLTAEVKAAPKREQQVAELPRGKDAPRSDLGRAEAEKAGAGRSAARVIAAVPSPRHAEPRTHKPRADLPTRDDGDGIIYIRTGFATQPPASHAAAPRPTMTFASRAESSDDAAAEVIGLLAEAERGPHFLWQDPKRPHG
jgi:Flp pilus assembly protein TadD